MEIKRKLMTETQLSEKESALKDEITAVRDENTERFQAIGYELDLAFESKTDEDYDYSVMNSDGEKAFPVGYVSRAVLTVKRPKTEADIETENEKIEETVEEAEQLGAELSEADTEAHTETDAESDTQESDDETLKKSEDELKRSVAFTRVMLIRVYRAFWVEKISLCDAEGIAQLRSDLDEFYAHLVGESSRAEE